MAQLDIGGNYNRGQRSSGVGELMSGVMQLARMGLEMQRDKARQEHTDFLERQSRKRTDLTRESFELRKEQTLIGRAEALAIKESTAETRTLVDKASREGTLAELSKQDLGTVGNAQVDAEIKQQAAVRDLGEEQQKIFNKQQSQDKLPAIGAEILGVESPEYKIFDATVAAGDFKEARTQLRMGVEKLREAAAGLSPTQEIALANSMLRAEELLVGGYFTKGSKAYKSIQAIKKRLNKLALKEFGVEADTLQYGTQQSTGRKFVLLPNGVVRFLDNDEEITF